MKRLLNTWPLAILISICVLSVLSWIGNVYGWNCRNVLSADGLRWVMARFMIHLDASPWGYVIMLTSAVSVIRESAVISGLTGQKNLKQKRAYMLVSIVLIALLSLVILLSLLPGNIFMSAFGTFRNSALERGAFAILTLVVYAISVIYGYATGRFFNLSDIYKATVSLTQHIATYFITLFLTSQLVAFMTYIFFTNFHSGLDRPLSVVIISFCLYWIPWLLHVVDAYKDKS